MDKFYELSEEEAIKIFDTKVYTIDEANRILDWAIFRVKRPLLSWIIKSAVEYISSVYYDFID